MLAGGSLGRRPESFWKKTNQGNLMPACRKTPAEAASSSSQTQSRCWSAAAALVIDLVTKPEVKGKAEIASAPIVPSSVVTGMVRKRPPSSVHLRRPVWCRTLPADMRRSAL